MTESAETPAVGAPPTGFAAVLRNRAFLSLWLAQICSQTAQNCLWYALVIMVGRLTGQSTLGIGVTIILVQLPTVLFSSLSGVLVDRVSKRMILVGTNVIRVVAVLLYILFQGSVAGLYLVTFVVAVISQPFAPAEGASIPLLVSSEELITANSLFQLTFMGAQAVGFAVGPIALTAFGTRNTLIGLAALFAVASLVLLPLPAVTRRHAPTTDVSWKQTWARVWRDLSEVLRHIMHDPPLAVALFQIALAPALLLILAEVGPDYLTHALHIGQTSSALFFLLAPAGAGLAVGMLVLGQWGHRLRKDRLVVVAMISLGITVIGLAAAPMLLSFWQRLAALGIGIPAGVGLLGAIVPITFLMGAEVAFINAPVQTIVQQRAPPALRGRVLALQQTIQAALAIPPLLLVGGFAAIFGTPATLALAGLFLISVGLVMVYYA